MWRRSPTIWLPLDHDHLRILLARRLAERRLPALFAGLLESHSVAPGKGLPIGALTSQYLGNFYLDSIDHWVNQKCHLHRYVRYLDDRLLHGDHETMLWVRPGCTGRGKTRRPAASASHPVLPRADIRLRVAKARGGVIYP